MEKLNNILSVSRETLNSLDTSFVNTYTQYLHTVDHNSYYFHLESGNAHYRLLMYISQLFNDAVIFDVGTNRTMSALALSYNSSNKIKSYDIIRLLPKNPPVPNIEFILGDSTLDKDLENSPLIFLDVDHDGKYENIFYDHIKSINWKGFLLLDDIHLNDPMKEFWQRIEEEKYDLTSVGAWSGTGLVIFK
jgi:hypothetical protein